MLNKKTTNFISNKLSTSLIKYNISYNDNNSYNNQYLSNLLNEETASKNLYKKRGAELNTRNALSATNNIRYILNKVDLVSISLIGQFDKKFCVFFRERDKSIIFFDQHAVHERILYEYYQELLLNEFYEYNSDNDNNKIKSNDVKLNLFKDIYGKYQLKKNKFAVHPKKFNININNFNNSFLFNKNNKIQTIFNYTWIYSKKSDLIIFYSVPIIFDKIHKIEVLMEIFSYIINNLENYWKIFNNKERNILEPFDLVIKSKACRNAIKFNDELDTLYMKKLLNELSLCKNPFLCAHGRHNYFIKYKKNFS